MAVIPSFGSFASTPNLAQSYLGGARLAIEQQQGDQRLALEQQQLAASIAQRSQQLQMEQQRLQQQMQMAEMELAAKSASQAREEMVRQQQNEIENQYKQQMIGLKNRELEQAQQKLQMEAEQASRTFAAQQEYTQLVASGKTPEEAIGLIGPKLGAPSGFYSASERGNRGRPDLGGATPIAGLPKNYQQLWTSENARQIINVPTESATSPAAESAKIRALSLELNGLNETLASPLSTDLKKKRPDEFDALTKRRDSLRSVLDKSTGMGAATIPSGSTNSASTNRIGNFNVIRNATIRGQ